MQIKGHMGWYDTVFTCQPFTFRTIHELLKIEETMGYHDPQYYASLHWSRIFEYPWVYATIQPEKDDIILDLGGGWGPLQLYLAQRCKRVYNFDMDGGIIPFLEASERTLGIYNVTLNLGDAVNGLPYEDCFFDKVVILSVLEHMSPPYQRYLDEVLRVTKVGGIIACTLDVCIESGEHKEMISVDTVKELCGNLGVRWVDPMMTTPMGRLVESGHMKTFAVMTLALQKVSV